MCHSEVSAEESFHSIYFSRRMLIDIRVKRSLQFEELCAFAIIVFTNSDIRVIMKAHPHESVIIND